MKNYHQLTLEQRCQIYAFKKAGFKQSQIAPEIGVSKSTISRELSRNRGGRGYRPKQAHIEAEFYFAHPYRSWERGTNENPNGLVRQYFPKGTDFAKITQREVKAVERRLNNRPRKGLGYRTPNEVFFDSPPVALRC